MDMDYIDWCSYVLQTCVQAHQTSEQVRLSGISPPELATIITKEFGIDDYGKRPDFTDSTFYKGLIFALNDLLDYGLVEKPILSFRWKVTKYGRETAGDLTSVWWEICADTLEPEHEQLLSVINQLSPQKAPDHVWLEELFPETLLAETGWEKDTLRLFRVAHELQELRYVDGSFMTPTHFTVQANYKGLVWETRRGITQESKFIDDLIAEWETTSVDFKRDVHTDTASAKAELIKDILSLANTRASGRRWMIIGFEDKSRDYYGPPDPKLTQNHLEQIMAQYTAPVVDLRYRVVDYRKGKVGVVEVLRDPKKLPYRVAKSLGDKALGDKKRIEKDQIFVRHGSQVEAPSADERKELQDEGDIARSL